jgi:hypothetical protein
MPVVTNDLLQRKRSVFSGEMRSTLLEIGSSIAVISAIVVRIEPGSEMKDQPNGRSLRPMNLLARYWLIRSANQSTMIENFNGTVRNSV